MIKNADELFRGNGIRMMTGSDKIGLIVGNPDLDKGSSYRELEMILQYEEGKIPELKLIISVINQLISP